MAKQRIAVRVEDELLSILEQVARGSGRNESQIIREALAQYLERYKNKQTCFARALALGIIGSGKGMPRDLSVNKKHFDDFGK